MDNNYMNGGLLSSGLTDDQRQALQNQSLLSLGAALLEAGGPHATKVGLGQGLGQGLQAMGGAQSQLLDQFYKQQAAQAEIAKAKAETEGVGLDNQGKQLTQKMMAAKLNLLPNGMFGGSDQAGPSGSMPAPQGVSGPSAGPGPSPGGLGAGPPPPPTPPGLSANGPTTGFDPNDVSYPSLIAIDQGRSNGPGSPKQQMALSNLYANLGDKDRSKAYFDLATNGAGKDGGFRVSAGDWNSNKPIMQADPNYIAQTEGAKAGAQFPYDVGKINATAAADALKPQIVAPGGALVPGPGLSRPISPPGLGTAPMPMPASQQAPQPQGQPGPQGGPQGVPTPQPAPMPPQGQPGPALPPQMPQGPRPIPQPAGLGVAPMPSNPGGVVPQQGPQPYFVNKQLPYNPENVGEKELAKGDADQVAKARGDASQANDKAAIAQQIQDLLPKVSTGWGANNLAEGASILQRLGVPDKSIQSWTGMDPTNTQELQKTFTQLATGAARQMGAREPGSVIQMFVKNNPNMEMTPQAITGMTNAMKMDSQYRQDLADAMGQRFAQSVNGARNGQGYNSLTGFQTEFNKTNSPSFYAKAAMAMSGNAGAWNGVSQDQLPNIVSKIPKGTPFVDDKGRVIPNGAGN